MSQSGDIEEELQVRKLNDEETKMFKEWIINTYDESYWNDIAKHEVSIGRVFTYTNYATDCPGYVGNLIFWIGGDVGTSQFTIEDGELDHVGHTMG